MFFHFNSSLITEGVKTKKKSSLAFADALNAISSECEGTSVFLEDFPAE